MHFKVTLRHPIIVVFFWVYLCNVMKKKEVVKYERFVFGEKTGPIGHIMRNFFLLGQHI